MANARDPRGNNAIGNAMGPVGFARPTFLKRFGLRPYRGRSRKGIGKMDRQSYRQLCGLVG
jgi:hypothetical protein